MADLLLVNPKKTLLDLSILEIYSYIFVRVENNLSSCVEPSCSVVLFSFYLNSYSAPPFERELK